MTNREMISLLLKARNLLHQQDEGKAVSKLDITFAHDYVDMVIDELVYRHTQNLLMLQAMQEVEEIDKHFRNQN
jgi:hypothetical protein